MRALPLRPLGAASAAALLVLAPALGAQNPLYHFNGDDAGDVLGYAVSNAGDVNGDGVPDILCGSFEDDFAATKAGSVRAYSGADGTLIHYVTGTNQDDNLGISCSDAGDVNGDGFDDFMAGAYHGDGGNGHHSGYARIYSGFDGSMIRQHGGNSPSDTFGFALAGVGDMNKDGFDDYIIGAHKDDTSGGQSGSVYAYSGVDGSLLWSRGGMASGDVFGISVSGFGDVNGDGCDDVLVGATGSDAGGLNTGSVSILSGKNGLLFGEIGGDALGDAFGVSVSGVGGDVNGDLIPDFVVGAYLADPAGVLDAGLARVFSGADATIIYEWTGTTEAEQLGHWVSDAGDVNADGIADIIIGAHNADDNRKNSGTAIVYSGFDGSIIFEMYGHLRFDAFGFAVSGLGDVNSDGYDDVLVGAPLEDAVTGKSSGSARVVSGAPLVTISPFAPGVAGQNNTLTATGADVGSEISFFSARNPGQTVVPFVTNQSLELALANLEATAIADANGEATFTAFIPPRAAGRRVAIQAWMKPNFTISNLLVQSF